MLRADSWALQDIREVYLTRWKGWGREQSSVSLRRGEHVQTGDTGSVVCAEAPVGTAGAPAQIS